MKKITRLVGLFGLFFSLAAPVLAETIYPTPFPTGPKTTTVKQKIKGGNLTLKAPETVTLDDIYTSAQVVTNTGTASNFYVDDARGTKTAAGWTATVTMSRLTDTTDSSNYIPFIDTVSAENLNGKVYTLTPTDPVNVYYSGTDGVTKGSQVELADEDNDGVSNSYTVMTAASGSGKGMFKNDIGIRIKVPVNTPAADYEATMTFTVV